MIWEKDDKISISGYGTAAAVARTVWPDNSIIPIPDYQINVSLSSSSPNDTAKGSGARYASVYGLDFQLNPTLITLELDGQNPVYPEEWNLRSVIYAEIGECGSTGSNEGIIYVGTGVVALGVPSVVHDMIPIGMGASQTCRYSVQAGEIFELESVTIETDIAVVDFVIQICKTINNRTVVMYQGSSFEGCMRFIGGETVSLRVLDASVSGQVFGTMNGKLKKL